MAFVLASQWISLNWLIQERFFVLNLLPPDRQLLPLVLPVGVESHLVKTSHYPERALLLEYSANSSYDELFLVESFLIPSICLNCCQQILIAPKSTNFNAIGGNLLDSPGVASPRFYLWLILVRSSPKSSRHCQQLLQIVNFRF